MSSLNIKFDSPAWPDLADKERAGKLIHIAGKVLEMTGLPDGVSGADGKKYPSVAWRLDLPDGRVVLYETSLKIFLTAAKIFRGRFGDPSDGTPGVDFNPPAVPNSFDVKPSRDGNGVDISGLGITRDLETYTAASLSPEQALDLAAWLVGIADPSLYHTKFMAKLHAWNFHKERTG